MDRQPSNQTEPLGQSFTVSAFLHEHKDSILHSWETRVLSEVRDLELVGLALRDDIPRLLDGLATWVATEATIEESPLTAVALSHVLQRLDAGMSLAQVFREYRLLREAIITGVLEAEKAEQSRAGVSGRYRQIARVEELARLNAGLDVVLSRSIEQFVEERDRRAAAERESASRAVRDSETRYRELFESIDEGFCIIEVLFDGEQPIDCRFLHVNPAFERLTGLTNVVGKRAREVIPDLGPYWFDIYGQVAKTGESTRFENTERVFERFYSIYAFRIGTPGLRQVAIVFSDITLTRQAEQELREADRRKNEFLGILSHELRNPLSPITNILYILDHAVPGGDQALRAQAVIGRQISQLTRLVDDLLDLTRITRNKINLQRQHLDLNELILRTLDDYRVQFENSQISLKFEPAPSPVFVYGDWNRLAQVIGNLLQNAIKFTKPGGLTSVAVSTELGMKRAAVRITDTGAGIAPEVLARLFVPFVQADATLDRNKGGLGLGLALVKGLLELHGGDIRAHSAGLGQGTQFVLRLPLEAPCVERAEQLELASTSPNRQRVLVIEDNIDAAKSLREVLEFRGHKVEVAYNGPDGIAMARNFRPEVVLCDIGLPGMIGYEVARAFRADEQFKGTHLLALSGYTLPADVQRATDAGFEQLLAKPPNLEKLEQLITKCSSAKLTH